MPVQSVLFEKSKFTLKTARAWLKLHKHQGLDVDVKPSHYRFRQFPPKKTYKYYTKKVDDGVEYIILY